MRYHARAKYIPDPVNGGLRLAMVQGFSRPVFNPSGITDDATPEERLLVEEAPEEKEAPGLDDIERATRRARIGAFDKILCTKDLDTFCTFTYDPGRVSDATSYDECYAALRVWLSNRVQRRGLKYVLVPERHKSGAIHFHAIMNSSALKLARAHSAKSGRALNHKGNPLYNVTDWEHGFSSAEIIKGGASDRDAVAKYIFKYMGKQVGQKIGGRYVLTGGELGKPVYVFGDSVESLCGGSVCKYERRVEVPGGGEYCEYSFL